MLGIVLDVIKFAQAYKRDEVLYLQSLLKERDDKITMLETIIFRRFGLIQVENAVAFSSDKKVVGSLAGWKEQQKMLEKKFRPPEFEEREERFREIAEKQAKELEGS
jgi:hypothetical protein